MNRRCAGFAAFTNPPGSAWPDKYLRPGGGSPMDSFLIGLSRSTNGRPSSAMRVAAMHNRVGCESHAKPMRTRCEMRALHLHLHLHLQISLPKPLSRASPQERARRWQIRRARGKSSRRCGREAARPCRNPPAPNENPDCARADPQLGSCSKRGSSNGNADESAGFRYNADRRERPFPLCRRWWLISLGDASA